MTPSNTGLPKSASPEEVQIVKEYLRRRPEIFKGDRSKVNAVLSMMTLPNHPMSQAGNAFNAAAQQAQSNNFAPPGLGASGVVSGPSPSPGSVYVQEPYSINNDIIGTPAEHFRRIVKHQQTLLKVYEYLSAQLTMNLFGDDGDAAYVFSRILQLGYREFCRDMSEGLHTPPPAPMTVEAHPMRKY